MAKKSIVAQIREVLDRYFQFGYDGNKLDNEEYDPSFSAQEALDEITNIVS